MLQTGELKDSIADMSLDELTAIQDEIRLAKRRKYQKRGKILHGYVGEEYVRVIPIVIDYLYDQKIMPHKTIYNLVKLSVELVVDDVLKKIKDNVQSDGTS